jgi:hypothetical protein
MKIENKNTKNKKKKVKDPKKPKWPIKKKLMPQHT